MNMPLIEQNQGIDPDIETRVTKLLALLRTQEDSHLIYDGAESLLVLRYLQRRVAARPIQLRNHIRRIYLSIQCRDRKQLYGALIDLLVVLKGRGQVLLKRILEQSRPLLNADDFQLMIKIGESGDLRLLNSLPDSESVMINGLLPLVARTR